jgi:hypothetical protein
MTDCRDGADKPLVVLDHERDGGAGSVLCQGLGRDLALAVRRGQIEQAHGHRSTQCATQERDGSGAAAAPGPRT